MAIKIAHKVHNCKTLGPGTRMVVWVRGCSLGCKGCIAAPILNDGPHLNLEPRELVDEVLQGNNEGITFSGGEPFEQAEAVMEAACLAQAAGLSVVTYTGHTFESLRLSSDPDIQELLRHTDILIDGPYEVALRADLLWRGSSNQRIHLLTERYAELKEAVDRTGLGVELRISPEGRVFWAGVPPRGFVGAVATAAKAQGLGLSGHEGVWA